MRSHCGIIASGPVVILMPHLSSCFFMSGTAGGKVSAPKSLHLTNMMGVTSSLSSSSFMFQSLGFAKLLFLKQINKMFA